MPPKPDHKANNKNVCFLEGLWIDFAWIVAPNLKVQGGVLKWSLAGCLGSWGPLGAKMAPRGPQKPPGDPQARFWNDFGGLFSIFWLIWVNLRLGFVVLVCWCAGCLVVCLACLLNFLAAGLPYTGTVAEMVRRATVCGAPEVVQLC